jgi:hypothetical protein
MLSVAIILIAGCAMGFQREYQEMMDNYERIRTGVDDQLRRYEEFYAQYSEVRQKYNDHPNSLVGRDSLHSLVRNQHDMLLEGHQAYRQKGTEILAIHEDIFERHELEDYPEDSVRADFKSMNADLIKVQGYFGTMNDEILQMIDEQQTMLQRIE